MLRHLLSSQPGRLKRHVLPIMPSPTHPTYQAIKLWLTKRRATINLISEACNESAGAIIIYAVFTEHTSFSPIIARPVITTTNIIIMSFAVSFSASTAGV